MVFRIRSMAASAVWLAAFFLYTFHYLSFVFFSAFFLDACNSYLGRETVD